MPAMDVLATPEEFMAAAAKLPNGNTSWAALYAGELQEIIKRQAERQPRSLQTHLGPSELGAVCDRKVIGKMVGQGVAPRTNHVHDPWPSIVGTAVHAWLAEKFANENKLNGLPFPRWLSEIRVTPDPYHPGTADLYDSAWRALVDWKVLGPTSMAKVHPPQEPPLEYQIQLLLYALGYRNMGLPVDRIVLAALPRTEDSLDAMYVWERPADPRADDQITDQVLAITAVRRQVAGEVLAGRLRIEDIPITPTDDGCFWCPFYRPQSARDGRPGCPGHSRTQ